jgi:hypothetical protein
MFCILFPPAGIVAVIILLHRRSFKPVYFTSKPFQSAPPTKTKEVAQSINNRTKFTTQKDQMERNVNKIIKPGFDPWAPENIERTLFLQKTINENREKSDQKMKEEIQREKSTPPKKKVEEILSEHRAKMDKKSSID